jgi:tetratricopeptide (TPR) repeat protein
MKHIRCSFCLAALAVAFSFPVSAADTKPPVGKRVPVAREAVHPPVDVSATGEAPNSMRPAQAVYQVLLAEIALQRGELELATKAYADLALRTRDPQVLERTVEVTGFARRYDLALEAARLWREVDPTSKRAQQMMISVMILSGKLDDLAPELVRMLEYDKAALPQNLLGLNRMFARNPDRNAVFSLIDKVCSPFFGLAEAHYAVALAAMSAGVKERALAEVRYALELRPDWEMAAFLQAQILAQDSAAEAIAFLQGFVERNPQAHDVRMQLARALVGEKRYGEARRHFDQLLEYAPDNPDVVYPVAILALQENDRALAEKLLKHMLTLSVPDKSLAYYYLGQIAEDDKRVDDALAYYAQIQSGERFLPAQLRAARLLVDQGRLDDGLKLLHAIEAGSPEESVQLVIGEAGLLRQAKMPEAAFDLLDRMLAEQPEQPDLLYESALLAERIGRFDVLELRLRKLIELRPESSQALNALGYSYADRNVRLPEARDLIEKALKLAPEDNFILDSMGWVLYRQGDLSGALGYLERSYAQRDDPEVAAHLGEVLWALGRTEDARRTLRDAQQKHPDNEALAAVIKKLLP